MRDYGDTVEENVGNAIEFVEPQSSQRGKCLSKIRFCVLLVLVGLVGFCVGAATISDVTARTTNGKVDIGYTITGVDATNTALVVTMTESGTGRIHTPTEEGRHRITWDTAVDGLNLISSNVTATVSLVRYGIAPTVTEYCVIDFSSGSDVTQWPVSYLSSVPTGGWTDEWKTTKLVLRRIAAGTFIMGDDQTDESHRVRLTKPFYMGVFEVTQKQWELVMGSWPDPVLSSSSGCGGTYPAYYVSYDDIRGSLSGAQWPASSAVDASSFLGRLREKTGLDFDLPTEAQWEYACRAGTTTKYYCGDSMSGACAWCKFNSDSMTHPVGTRLPNAWGLYDMSGNVLEWFRDWYGNGTLAYGTDPKGSTLGWLRGFRGGDYDSRVVHCTSSSRFSDYPSTRYINVGFRIVCVLSD